MAAGHELTWLVTNRRGWLAWIDANEFRFAPRKILKYEYNIQYDYLRLHYFIRVYAVLFLLDLPLEEHIIDHSTVPTITSLYPRLPHDDLSHPKDLSRSIHSRINYQVEYQQAASETSANDFLLE